MYRSPTHWTDPDRYHPERFLNQPEFANDHLDALQPFSVGARNCIGMKYALSSYAYKTRYPDVNKSLAFAEMRLILTRILFSFDLDLSQDSMNWLTAQEAHLLWRKPALNVKLTPIAINE